jgi:hypothetical protein
MRRANYAILTLAFALLLLAGVLFLVAYGPGTLDSQMTFMSEFHNSLSHLDQAKWEWAQEKHMPERAVPTMEDLTPYLGEWTNRIQQLVALGIRYKITPISEMEPQSDIATLTRDLRFRNGSNLFCAAGTQYSIHNGWAHFDSGGASWLRAFYFIRPDLPAVALFILGIGHLLAFYIIRIRNATPVNSNSV